MFPCSPCVLWVYGELRQGHLKLQLLPGLVGHSRRPHSSFGALSSRIGCGLDGLQWEKVSAILEEVFENTDIKITVYTL